MSADAGAGVDVTVGFGDLIQRGELADIIANRSADIVMRAGMHFH